MIIIAITGVVLLGLVLSQMAVVVKTDEFIVIERGGKAVGAYVGPAAADRYGDALLYLVYSGSLPDDCPIIVHQGSVWKVPFVETVDPPVKGTGAVLFAFVILLIILGILVLTKPRKL